MAEPDVSRDPAAEPDAASETRKVNAPAPPRKDGSRGGVSPDPFPGRLTRDAPGQRPAASIEERRQPQSGGRGTRALAIAPDSYDAEQHTVQAVLSAGSPVQRYYFVEELEISPEAIDITRVDAGICPLLDTHNQFELAAQIGRVVSVGIEDGRLVGTLQFDQTPGGQDIEARVARGELRAISIGYQVSTWQITSTPASTEMETWRAMNWQLLEASFVPVPADPNAVVRSAPGNQQHGTTTEEEEMRRNLPGGAAAAAPTPPATAADDTAPGPATPVAEQRAAPTIAASRILDMCGRSPALGSDFASELIRLNETTPLTESDLLGRVNERLLAVPRPQIDARAGATGTETEGYRQAVEDAVTLRANPGSTMDAARVEAAREFRGMTMMELSRDYLQRTGIRVNGMGRLELAGAALGMRYGALTTSDFASALAAVANKRVRAAFTAAPQTFRPIVATGTLPDFKPANIVGLGDAPALLNVPENGEFKRGAISDTGLTYRLQTYGRIIAITRQAIVNDDQNLFGRIPTMFGRKAADLESDLVWGILLSNPIMGDGIPLFDARHGNLAGAGSGISVASLGAARQAMRQQTSNEGGFLNIAPTFLIVGPAKEVEAQQMLAAVVANQNAAVNPFSNSLTPIVEPRITGNQWFLASSPDAFDTLTLDHLLGQEELFTDSRVGFDVDGVEIKARLDVGAAAIDSRGFYKNSGN